MKILNTARILIKVACITAMFLSLSEGLFGWLSYEILQEGIITMKSTETPIFYRSNVGLYDIAFNWDIEPETAWLLNRLGEMPLRIGAWLWLGENA